MGRHFEQEIPPSKPPSHVFVLPIKSSKTLGSVSFFFLGGAVCLVMIIVLLIVLLKLIRADVLLKIMLFKKNSAAPEYISCNLHAITYFDYGTLRKATKNFNPKGQLGRGGFGPVYQGELDDGRMIAVKQLSLGKCRQGESQFLAEVKMITNVQHKNLVRLIGYCSEGAQRLLIYEYMKHKSLDCIVFGDNRMFLDWSTRFQIIMGIARGLQYLHEDSNIRIIHRDIKASNILLDDKLQPKIGDFGLARFFPEDQAYLSTTVAGTLGYTAPEYALRGELSEKADIYSFGVLVLEIISSRKNADLELPSEVQYLPEYAWKLYETSKLIDLVDSRLKADGFEESDALHVCQIALLCIQAQPELRPPMSEIVGMLTCKIEPTSLPIKPVFVNWKASTSNNISRESVPDHPSNSLSASVLQNATPNVPPSDIPTSDKS